MRYYITFEYIPKDLLADSDLDKGVKEFVKMLASHQDVMRVKLETEEELK